MEQDLVCVKKAGRDLVVAISGFGSAGVSPERWSPLAELTGRTTYSLSYDAQELPWPLPPGMSLSELFTLWSDAVAGADHVCDWLSGWIRRWTSAGRRVMLVGFSLGAHIAVRAASMCPSSLVDVVCVSGAFGIGRSEWRVLSGRCRVWNFYSTRDLALRYVFPSVTPSSEALPCGVRPVLTSPGVHNCDITDMVGYDHLWCSTNLASILPVLSSYVFGAGTRFSGLYAGTGPPISAGSLSRLYSWVFVDPELSAQVDAAVAGDSSASATCAELDRWSCEGGRLGELIAFGRSYLAVSRSSTMSARRSEVELRGLLRQLLSESGFHFELDVAHSGKG